MHWNNTLKGKWYIKIVEIDANTFLVNVVQPVEILGWEKWFSDK